MILLDIKIVVLLEPFSTIQSNFFQHIRDIIPSWNVSIVHTPGFHEYMLWHNNFNPCTSSAGDRQFDGGTYVLGSFYWGCPSGLCSSSGSSEIQKEFREMQSYKVYVVACILLLKGILWSLVNHKIYSWSLLLLLSTSSKRKRKNVVVNLLHLPWFIYIRLVQLFETVMY